jgi:hypothetical protein
MKAALLAAAFFLGFANAQAFEIFAIGTSNTNCKGVDRPQSFTFHLEELLRAEGFDATVINSGVDGDRPVWMAARLFGTNGINANTRLVIFEPGPNDRNVSANLAFSEKILAQLQERKMPTIYISSRIIQKAEEAQATAQKYGAYYYGYWSMDVPNDRTHRQYDMAGGGHMTGEGCQRWAKNMLPFVRKVLAEIGIAATAKR